ncbi:MAG: D-alanyl-D-alanine carboxypeptidase family protein [Oscillospiraceae bacterium]
MKRFIAAVLSGVMLAAFTPKTNAVQSIVLSAKAAILIEADTGAVILAKSENSKLPMASTTKIMTTLLTLESGDLDKIYPVPDEALMTEGSSMGLCFGESVTKNELCYGMMLPSGNDAANTAALLIGGSFENFAKLMNRRAAEIGMKNTNFVTPSGLHDDEHYSTAYDMALLTREALKNERFCEICQTKEIKLSSEGFQSDKYLSNTNRLLKKYKYCIGVKTGFTDEAGRCLVSAAEKDGVKLIAVTLNASDDWNDHIKMYETGFSCTKRVKLDSFTETFDVKTVGGISDSISCRLSSPPECTAVNGTLPDISEKIYLPDFVYAPVMQGDEIGYAEYSANGEVFCRRSIVADQACPYKKTDVKKSLYNSVIDKLKKLFK